MFLLIIDSPVWQRVCPKPASNHTSVPNDAICAVPPGISFQPSFARHPPLAAPSQPRAPVCRPSRLTVGYSPVLACPNQVRAVCSRQRLAAAPAAEKGRRNAIAHFNPQNAPSRPENVSPADLRRTPPPWRDGFSNHRFNPIPGIDG
ncbi:hypothetical protein AcV7_003803 [Taiwanofungus camphoratus]|nr:hypothetical protein AcV7_003803 [Antrodia cinnamomea]